MPANQTHTADTVGATPSSTLRFITCGSVDDGKSTLIGRLLLDSNALLHDQLHAIRRRASSLTGDAGTADLALLTDGLSAEREQGITIDVAYRYFSTLRRKFIIGDTPGHAQYTRNMVTAASNADAAVILVDATRLASPTTVTDSTQWTQASLLPQTRRHGVLVNLLSIPHIIFAVNKLDMVTDPTRAFAQISQALKDFARKTGIDIRAIVPISALYGNNVVHADHLADYHGASLLGILETLPLTSSTRTSDSHSALTLPVQWVEKPSIPTQGPPTRRIYWGRITSGRIKTEQTVHIHPGGLSARIINILDHCRHPIPSACTGASVGLTLNENLDISRGDCLMGNQFLTTPDIKARKQLRATLAWLDSEPLVTGRTYHALHGHRWVKTRVEHIEHVLNIDTLETEAASELVANAIGTVVLQLQQDMPVMPYAVNRHQGAMILADSHHNTVAAVMVQ